MRGLPGVTAVTFDNNLPMSGKPRDAGPVRLFGQSKDEEARNPFVHYHIVGPDYFDVMGIRLAAGRAFTDNDRIDTEPVAVVSRRTAERLWPGQEPIGRRFQYADTANRERWLTVIGVAAPVLHHELDGEPGMDTYIPFTQERANGPYYVLRTGGDPMRIAQAATAIIGRVDPNQSFLDVQTYDSRIANRMWQRRLSGALFAGFAALAVLLAAVGLYGVLAQVVAQQTRDIGVRMALGAARSDILRLVMGRGLALAGLGAAVALVLAVVMARACRRCSSR
jgi:putative ABC transport system permease protein